MSQLELLNSNYEVLRRMARRVMQRENRDHTLSATALVHEAYLRLADSQIKYGPQFLSAAAETMRRVLIDYARSRKTRKRGRDFNRCELADFPDPDSCSNDHMQSINVALERLEASDPQAALIVKLRFFCGFTLKEVAEMLNMPLRSAERTWALTRAWLSSQLKKDDI